MSIQLKNVGFSFEDSSFAVRNLNLEIAEGSFHFIAGKSGSGKTTLLKLIKGILPCKSGEIITDNPGSTGLLFQNAENQLFAGTVLEDVMFGPLSQGAGREEAEYRARQALRDVGLESNVEGRDPFVLSQGQRRLVALAGILAMKPSVLILDEITASLDSLFKTRVCKLLQRLNKEGKTIIAVTHNPEEIALYADSVSILEDGRLLFCGEASEALTDEKLMERAGLGLPVSALILKEAGLEDIARKGRKKIIRPDELTDFVTALLAEKPE